MCSFDYDVIRLWWPFLSSPNAYGALCFISYTCILLWLMHGNYYFYLLFQMKENGTVTGQILLRTGTGTDTPIDDTICIGRVVYVHVHSCFFLHFLYQIYYANSKQKHYYDWVLFAYILSKSCKAFSFNRNYWSIFKVKKVYNEVARERVVCVFYPWIVNIWLVGR